ncbi:MAG: hypothetical protein ACI9UT_002888, partial [Flavobacteriales bacterium]
HWAMVLQGIKNCTKKIMIDFIDLSKYSVLILLRLSR